jgi:hypothetical protein
MEFMRKFVEGIIEDLPAVAGFVGVGWLTGWLADRDEVENLLQDENLRVGVLSGVGTYANFIVAREFGRSEILRPT